VNEKNTIEQFVRCGQGQWVICVPFQTLITERNQNFIQGNTLIKKKRKTLSSVKASLS